MTAFPVALRIKRQTYRTILSKHFTPKTPLEVMNLHFSSSGTSKVGTSKAGFIFRLIFQFAFVAAGAGACYWGYRMYYVEGEPWQAAALFAGIGGVFILSSLFMLVRLFRRREQAAERERLRKKHAGEPWMLRPAWRDGRIETAEQDGGSGGLLFGTVVWNAVSWPLAYFAFFKGAGEGAAWITLIFPLVGLGLAVYLVYDLMRRRKYGDTVLELETLPGVLGGRFTGVARTGVKTDDAPDEGFHLKLSCFRRRMRYRYDGDGDRRKEVDLDLLWRDEKRLRARPYFADDGAQKLEVPVSFKVPAGQPASTAAKTENRILWRLDLSAEVPGIDFSEELEVPIFDVESNAGTAEAERAGTDAAAEPEPGEATVFWEMDGEAATLKREEAEAAAPAENRVPVPDADPYDDYEIGREFTAPVSAGIEVRPSAGGGIEFFFDKARNKGTLALVAVLFAGLAAGAVLLLGSGRIMAGLFVALFAAALGYATYRQATYTTTLTVERGRIGVRRGPFGGGATETFPAAELEVASVSVAGQSGRSAHYALELVRAGTETAQAHARRAEKTARPAAAVETVIAGGMASERAEGGDTVHRRITQAGGEQARTVKVAGGLADKQEADWLAAQIEAAAQREARYG